MKNYVIMDNWTISQSLQRPCYQTSLHVALRGTKRQTDATCEATRLEIHGSKAIFAICYRAVGTVLTVAIFWCPPARRPADHSPMVSACEATSRPLTDGVRLRGNQPTTHRWCPPARRPADHSPMVSALLNCCMMPLSMSLLWHSFSSIRYTSTLQCFTNMPCSITCLAIASCSTHTTVRRNSTLHPSPKLYRSFLYGSPVISLWITNV